MITPTVVYKNTNQNKVGNNSSEYTYPKSKKRIQVIFPGVTKQKGKGLIRMGMGLAGGFPEHCRPQPIPIGQFLTLDHNNSVLHTF